MMLRLTNLPPNVWSQPSCWHADPPPPPPTDPMDTLGGNICGGRCSRRDSGPSPCLSWFLSGDWLIDWLIDWLSGWGCVLCEGEGISWECHECVMRRYVMSDLSSLVFRGLPATDGTEHGIPTTLCHRPQPFWCTDSHSHYTIPRWVWTHR